MSLPPSDSHAAGGHAQALPPETALQEYRIERVLGHGGFGITYLATDTVLNKPVAIKEYLPVEVALRLAGPSVQVRTAADVDDYRWGLDRFLDEARTLARFRHPNLVPVLRFFEAHETAYMVMEYEAGDSLTQWLRARPTPPPEAELRALLMPLLDGLATVHGAGFLHRDIKPENVIVKGPGVPVLIDFGAARQALGGRSRTLTSIVTPRFAPLEQYSLDGGQGPWSDIYALAAVLHAALTGAPPPEALSRLSNDPYLPLAGRDLPGASPALRAAIDWGLAVFPEDRPSSVDEWRRALDGEIVPPAAPERRRPGVVAASIAVDEGAPTRRLEEPVPSVPRMPAAVRLGAAEPVAQVSRPNRRTAPPAPGAAPRRLPPRAMLWAGVAGLLLAGAAAGMWLGGGEPPQTAAVAPIEGQPGQPGAAAKPGDKPADSKPTDPKPADSQPAGSKPADPKPASGQPDAKPGADPKAESKPGEKAAEGQPAAVGELAAAATQRIAGEARSAAEAAEVIANNARTIASDARGLAEHARHRAAQAEGMGGVGLGSVDLPDGGHYAGEVEDGRIAGAGVATWPDGRRYEGQWRNGVPEGRGAMSWPDGRRHEGDFKDGKRHGLGVTELANRFRYEGEWRDDALHGMGVAVFGEHDRQAGQWRDNRLQGLGVQRFGDGRRYEGEWNAGQFSGRGILTTADGKPQAGVWEANALARPD